MTVGWLLSEKDRKRLLDLIPPRYPDVVADHVTFDTGAAHPPQRPAESRIIGEADDGAGVQAVVVEIDGVRERPDGGAYHITWSLDRGQGREPVESNDVIRDKGWKGVAAQAIRLEPARLDS